MRTTRLICLLALLAAGCAALKRGEHAENAPETKEIVALHAATAPTIDGKLDDPCWREAVPVTGFLLHGTTQPARHQTFGRVAYDDSHIYIGMKCMVPKGVKLKGQPRVHDSNHLFSDEIVEIMLDPGRTKADYYQLVMSVAGATFDCSRKKGGRHEDDAWNGEWEGKASTGDGYWCAELAVPYHNLGVTAKVGPNWGINLCRESPAAKELSTLGADGMFNHAWTFASLRGLHVNFRKYAFPIGPEIVELDAGGAAPEAVLTIPVRNRSGAARKVKIERYHAGPDGRDAVEAKLMTLADGEAFEWECEQLALKPSTAGRGDVFDFAAPPATKRIAVSDAETGTTLSVSLTRTPSQLRIMRLEKLDGRAANYRRQTAAVHLKVHTSVTARDCKRGELAVTLTSRETGKTAAAKMVSSPSPVESIALKTKDLPPGAYDVRAGFRNASGREVAWASIPVMVFPGGERCIKPLNNLVNELMNARERGLLQQETFAFVNPREGWVYVRVDADLGQGGRLAASLRGASPMADVVVLEDAAGQRNETMRCLPPGLHTLALDARGKCTVRNVIVRAIPELVYSRFNSNPHTAPFGPYAGEFQDKYICDNVNVFVSGGDLDKQPHAKPWRDRGGRWLLHCSVPQETEDGKPITADGATDYIAKTYGYTQGSALGSIADEFGDSQVYCAPYADAVRRLRGQPGFANKRFYPYANNLYNGPEGRKLVQALVDTGGRIAWKRYLKQQPNEHAARLFLEEHLIHAAEQYRELCPNSLEHIVVCFGIFSAPNEFLNSNPEANYRTYLDMQFHTVATHPAFRGTYGLMSYLSSYCDEETLRWVAHLFRHYGIEGRTDRATTDPYDMTHLRNGDFARGLEGWTVRPAQDGSMTVRDCPGFGWLQGRYPRTAEGDTALVTVRSAKRPNVFSQTIKDLDPGKLYSLRLFSGDFEDMSKKEQHAATVKLDRVELVPEQCFTHVIANCYSHHYGPYDRKKKAWMNYHWRIFRAKARTATLTVTDWASAREPGGPVGQKLMFNYAVVQPYFAP